MVHFDTIRISHFRSYINTELNLDYETGVYIINGDNGAGKSTFLNAINWCLYGDTPFYSTKKYVEVANVDDPEGAETSVELLVTIDDYKYRFFRSTRKGAATTGKLSVSRVRSTDSENWEVLKSESECREAVRQLVPRQLRQLFFFNGEQLKDIYSGTGEDGQNSLRDNVYRVSELDVIDDGIKHLETLRKRYARQINKSSKDKDKIERLQADIEQLESGVKGSQELIDKYREQEKDYQAQINGLNRLLTETADARAILREQKECSDHLKEIDDQLFNLEQDRDQILAANFHSAILFPKFKEYNKVLEKATASGKIPAEVDPRVTRRILDTGECLCGRCLGEKERAAIQELHDDYAKKQELQFLTDGIYKFSEITEKLTRERERYEDLLGRIQDLQQKKQTVKLRLKMIENNLSEMDAANIPDNPEGKRRKLQNALQQNSYLLVNAAKTKDENERALVEKQAALKRLRGANKDTQFEQDKDAYAEVLINQLELIKAKMEEIIRTKLEKKIWQMFTKILPNTEYDGVEISEGYSIRLKRKGETYPVEMLSTGSAKVLGLALIYALSMDLGYHSVPLLIDNLYGDIAETHHEDMSDMVNALAQDKQVIVMNLIGTNATKTHFDGENVRAHYIIVNDDNTHEAEIKLEEAQ